MKQGERIICSGDGREYYSLSNTRNLVVETDNVKLFGFNLGANLKNKAEIETALTHFWPKHLYLANDQVESCSEEYEEANAVVDYDDLKGKDLKKSLVVKKTGSCLFSLRLNGETTFLKKGEVISKKEFVEALTSEGRRDEATWVEVTLEKAFKKAKCYATIHGVQILSSEFNFSFQADKGWLLVGKILTPDTTKFLLDGETANMTMGPLEHWAKGLLTPFQKDGQKIIGIHNLDSTKKEHIAFVEQVKVPDHILELESERRMEFAKRILDSKLSKYQKHHLLA